MDAFRGFMSGLFATVLWAGMLGLGAYRGEPLDLPWMLGTAFLEPTEPYTWGVGAAGVVLLGAIFGLVHAQVYEEWRRSGPIIGGIVGLLHAAVAGTALGFVAGYHPHMPELIPDPGYFGANIGPDVVTIFLAAHVLYGMATGSLYRPESKP